jgi:hypothetical protein
MEQLFVACAPDLVQRTVFRTLVFRKLPKLAERDVEAALLRVTPTSQSLLIQAAEDGLVPERVAMDRLACLWVTAAAVNLADDLADGDCDYLEPRVAPGVSFLLQSLACVCAARGGVSALGMEEHAIALTRAAAGQSLEVRTARWDAVEYMRVAGLIAAEQYAAYFRLLWDGTQWQEYAFSVGRAIGTIGIVMTDLAADDRRFTSMPAADQQTVVAACHAQLQVLAALQMPSLRHFCDLAERALGCVKDGTNE